MVLFVERGMVNKLSIMQFAAWLKGGKNLSNAELSPMAQDFRDLGPIYLQAGGREILVDMIRDFAQMVVRQGGQIRLDVWADMNHEFHGYGNVLPESREALARLREAIAWVCGRPSTFATDACTACDSLDLRPFGQPPCEEGRP